MSWEMGSRVEMRMGIEMEMIRRDFLKGCKEGWCSIPEISRVERATHNGNDTAQGRNNALEEF